MQSFLIIGNLKDRQDYIHSFLIENKIPSYNIFTYEEKLKIIDARDIKKKLGIKGYGNTPRVFIINEGGTLEAQNALLKSIEELPSDVIFFFSSNSKDSYLPTIISRSSVKHFKQELAEEDREIDAEIEKIFIKPSPLSFLKLSDFLFNNKEEKNYEKLVFSLRKVMLYSVNKSQDFRQLTEILYKLNKNYSLVMRNNLNKRFLVEKIFLETFK